MILAVGLTWKVQAMLPFHKESHEDSLRMDEFRKQPASPYKHHDEKPRQPQLITIIKLNEHSNTVDDVDKGVMDKTFCSKCKNGYMPCKECNPGRMRRAWRQSQEQFAQILSLMINAAINRKPKQSVKPDGYAVGMKEAKKASAKTDAKNNTSFWDKVKNIWHKVEANPVGRAFLALFMLFLLAGILALFGYFIVWLVAGPGGSPRLDQDASEQPILANPGSVRASSTVSRGLRYSGLPQEHV